MNKTYRMTSILTILLVLVASLALPAQAWSPEPPVAADDAPRALDQQQTMQSSGPSQPVILRADPTVNFHHTPPPARALAPLKAQSATITINYLPAGSTDAFGTPCLTWPTQAQTAFSYAADIWETLINSSVTIVIQACWADLETGVLGYGGADNYYSNFTGAPVANTWYPSALANALAGSDLGGTDPDMHLAYSKDFQDANQWYFGTDGNTPGTQYDFTSVVLHEIAHGLGFSGSMRWESGTGSWGGGTGKPISYDRFTEDGSGNALINTAIYPNPSTALGSALTSGNIWFDGPNANAANSGGRVRLYAPSTWQSGSSYSHLDEIFNNTDHALMTYSLAKGESNHNPGTIAMGILQDVGWTTEEPTPPPSVTSITPNNGLNTGSVSVTIGGSDFQTSGTTGVRLTRTGESDIDGTSVTVVNDTTITCNFDLTGATAGAWNVVVTNPDEQSDTLTDGFTVTALPAPSISSITPNTGVNTGTVSITDLSGANFRTGATVKLTRTGESAIDGTGVTVVNSNTITCDFDLTGATAGAWNVVVTNSDDQSDTLTDGFTVTALPAPSISSITPNTGVNTGTVSITDLSGENFRTGATVKLTMTNQPDIVGTDVTLVNSTTITCTFDLTGVATGPWNVVVTNSDDQSDTLTDGFTVNGSPTAPTLTSITPNTGVNTGTLRITNLAGTNFTTTGVTSVTMTRLNETAITAASVTVVGPSQITCDLDLADAAPGQWNIIVTNPDGQQGYLSNGFTVEAGPTEIYLPLVMRNWPPLATAPTITSISPNPSTDGSYTVSWSAGAGPAPTSYDIEENGTVILTDYVGTSRGFSGKSPGTYTYRVRGKNAYGAGPWSSQQQVVVQTTSGPTPGFWESSTGDEFYVTADRAYVNDFAIYISVPNCGSYKITHLIPEPISDNQFSFSGSFYANGTFSNPTSCSGQDGLDNFYIEGCGYVDGGPWSWNATWQYNALSFMPAKVVEPDVVTPVTGITNFYTVIPLD